MQYVSADEIVLIHDLVVETFGGSGGLRERGLLDSIVAKPLTTFGGKELYADDFAKVACVYEALCKFHVFGDGNKRTAALVMYRMMHINGLELTATNKELEDFTMRMVEDRVDLEEVANWVKDHSSSRLSSH